jgi:GeoRSP system SPASM domain protein
MWELFHGKENPKEDGCDGAKTMMYISENFDVTPCPIISVSLGNLCTATLKEIFSSEKREQTRKTLSKHPQECRDCKVLNRCKGGCRGRAYVQYGNFDKQDPACLIFLRGKIPKNWVI